MSFFEPVKDGSEVGDEQLIEALAARIATELRSAGLNPSGRPFLTHLERTRRLYNERRMRDAHFDGFKMSEPPWDILLDLYIAHCEGRTITVSSACIAAAVPTSTALRSLMALVRSGLVVRKSHASDARCRVVMLSEAGLNAMHSYLQAMG